MSTDEKQRHGAGSAPRALALAASASLVILAQVSCAARPGTPVASGKLKAEDFRAAPGPGASTPQTVGTAVRAPAAVPIHPSQANEGLLPLEALVGPPRTNPPGASTALVSPSDPSVASSATAQPVATNGSNAVAPAPPPTPGAGPGQMIDSLVGQINGRPVYASEFLEPLDKRLGNMVAELNNDSAWVKEARGIIMRQLRDRVRDELVLAEAQSSLSPEQRHGLLAFINHLRGEVVSQQGGGEAAVDANLRDSGGKGLDDKVKDAVQTQLVQNEIRVRVASKINVSWRDVRLEYQRRYDEFNPAPTAVFRLIMVPAGNTTLVDDVSSRLGRGEAFAEVAAVEGNLFNRADGGIARRTFKGEMASGEFFAPELNETARRLEPGSTAGPIAFGERKAWISLETIERPPGKSLYQVQQTLFREIRERRMNEEGGRYLERLFTKGSYSNLQSMADRLVMIASDRYLAQK